MSSGAGEVVNRRRRASALFIFSCFRCFLLRVFYKLSSQIHLSKLSRTFSPSMSVKGKLKSCDRERRWCLVTTLPIRFLNIIPSPTPSTYCDALSKDKLLFIVTFTFSTRSGSAQSPQEEFSHWASLMARDFSLGPSDAPCLVESSTAHGEFIFWMALPWLSNRTSTTKLVSFLIQNLGSSRSVPKPDHKSIPNHRSPATTSITDHSALLVSNRKPMNEQPPLGRTMGMTTGETLILQMGCFLGMGLAAPGPERFRPRPVYDFIGQTQSSSWPRSVYYNLLTNPKLSLSFNVAESGRRLHFRIALTLLVRLVKYQLITLEEDTFNVVHHFDLGMKPMIQPSSLIERTFAWSPNPLLRNRLCTPTVSLESECIKPVLLKIKDPFSTSLCPYWNVTNHQSPAIFVELISTRHSLACGKFLSWACLRCLDLPSIIRIYFLYLLLLRVLVAFYDISNHVVDVCLNFVLGMD